MWSPDPIREEALNAIQIELLLVAAAGNLWVEDPSDPSTEPAQMLARKGLIRSTDLERWQPTVYGWQVAGALGWPLARCA